MNAQVGNPQVQDDNPLSRMTFARATATLRTIAQIHEVGTQLLQSAGNGLDAFIRTQIEFDQAATAYGMAAWLAVGYRLGPPWKDLSVAVVTGRHRVTRR